MEKHSKYSKAIEKDTNTNTEKRTEPGFCPECGAYVGAFYACPWCKNVMPHGRRLRSLQIGSIVAVLIGLISLSLFARIEPAPLVNIGDLGPTYSNGVVTIEGEITNIDYREANDDSWRTLIFTVEDKTGSIDIKAYTEVVDELINTKNTPAIGDECKVRGSVYIRGDDFYLYLESSSYLEISRDIDYKMTAEELYFKYNESSKDYLGKRVKVRGTVTYVGQYGTYFYLDDYLKIFTPDYVRKFAPNVTISVVVGDYVEVKGIVDEYLGEVEVIPGSMYDIEILSGGAPEE